MSFYNEYEANIGPLWIIEEEEKIIGLGFGGIPSKFKVKKCETPLIKNTFAQVNAYLLGHRKFFDIPINPQGTKFQMQVWQALLEIPYGETRSYGQVAEIIGNKKACRAVGGANNRNPISIIIPCHRVIGTNGKLVGYAGGLPTKERLLAMEKSNF